MTSIGLLIRQSLLTPCLEERFDSRPWWNSLRCLQMSCWPGFEIPLSCLYSSLGGKYNSWLFCWKSDSLSPQDFRYWWLWKDYSISWRSSPVTLCNYDCKFLTSAICRGLHWYTLQCIHPSQTCISTRQMTDNIFEIETTALAYVACDPQDAKCPSDWLCRCVSQCQSLLDLVGAREHWIARLSRSLPAKFL